MALEVAAWQTDRGGLTLWVPAAKELFARLRAGESYTVASDWDGTAFALADPCETVVGFVQGPAPEGTCADEFVVTLATEPGDIEERFEWYSKLGFAAADDRGPPPHPGGAGARGPGVFFNICL